MKTALLLLSVIFAILLAMLWPARADSFGPAYEIKSVLNVADNPLADAPAPAPRIQVIPVYSNPDTFQADALKWIGVATTLIAALSVLGMFIITKLGELRRTIQAQREELGGRLDRQQGTLNSQQRQISTVLLNTPPGAPALMLPAASQPQDDKKASSGLVGAAIAALACLFLMGCSTTGPDPVKNLKQAKLNAAGSLALKEAAGVLGDVVVASLFNAASQELGGKKADFGSAVASGLWQNVNSGNVLDRADRIVSAYSGGTAPNTAKAVNDAIASAVPGATTEQVVNALAAVISTSAGAPPAKSQSVTSI